MKLLTLLHRGLFALVALGTTLFLSGCLQIEQSVTVKADGSGNIVLSMKMSHESLTQLKALSGGQGDVDPLKDMLNTDKAEAQAKKLGEGVKFEKIEEIKDAKFVGKRAIYSFADVTKLAMDTDFSDLSPGGGEEKKDKKGEPVKFKFTKGSPATLEILSKHEKPSGKKGGDDKEPGQQEIAMMQQFLKDMKMTIAVGVEGKIVETDAAHQDGSRVILAEVPFAELVKDVSKLKAMKDTESFEAAFDLLKDVPGVKIEPKEKVTVKFQ